MRVAIADAAADAGNKSRRFLVVLHLARRLDLHLASVIQRDRLPPVCLSAHTHPVNRR